MVQVMKLINVKKSFNEKVLFSDINLEIGKGESISIMGQSGVGKTTLLDIICGNLTDFEGEVVRSGEKYVKMDQHPILFSWMNVREQLKLLIRGSEDQEIYKRLVNEFKISKFLELYPYELSGGIKQRVSLAQVILMKPDILILDEPFNGLDEKTKKATITMLKRTQKMENFSIIIVTHNSAESKELCEKEYQLFGTPPTLMKVK